MSRKPQNLRVRLMPVSEGLSRKVAAKGLADFIEIETGFCRATPGGLKGLRLSETCLRLI